MLETESAYHRFIVLLLLIAVFCLTARADINDYLPSAVWSVRDVAAGSEFYTADPDGTVPQLQMMLEREDPNGTEVWTSCCTVIDTAGYDRAVTLALSIPIDANGWVWWDDPQAFRTISGTVSYSNLVDWWYGSVVQSIRLCCWW
ncbi:MAG: hypothetical protein DRP62_07955 [Planctomycetota bacterium]|nr:MAG: hypothetical protein DRP62_07955 [Planctomycetota bacterium]